jgi:hypothetical protein
MSLSKFQRYQGSLTQEVFSGELVDPDESSEEQVSSDPDFSRLTMIDSRVVGEERDVRVAAEEALDTRGSGMPKYHHPTLFMLRHLIEIFSAGEMSKVALKKKRIRRHAGLCGIVRRHGGITSAYHQGWNSVEVVASWEAFDGMHKVDERGIVYKAKEVRKGPNGLVAAYFPVAKDVFPGNSLVEIGWVRCILSGRGRKMANKFRRMFILDSLESLVPQPNDMD